MDYANEHYVRLYTRDTTTWKRLQFEGQTVLMHVLRKLDRAGVLDIEDMEPWEAAALHCAVPEAIARPGMEACLRLGVFVHHYHFLVAPKYREANEASKTDRQRQLESRERRRALAMTDVVTGGDDSSQAVTPRHASASRNVTDRHKNGQSVTPGHTPSQSVTLNLNGSGSVAGAVPDHDGTGPSAAATSQNFTGREIPNLTSSEVAAEWNRVGAPVWKARAQALFQPHDHHRPHFTALAVACNAEPDPRETLATLLAYFWTADHGPVGSGRIANPTPKQCVEGFTRDLAEARAWRGGVARATSNGVSTLRPELMPFPELEEIPK